MTDDVKKKIIALRREGLKDYEIAEILGISRSIISYNCPKEAAKKKNRARKENVKVLVEQGMTLCEAADSLKIARSTVYEWFGGLNGIERTPRKRVNAICPVCGNEFKKKNKKQRYCSPGCSRKANKTTSNHIRRIRKENQTIDKDITLEGLYRRDSGFCYICGMKCSFEDYIVRGGRKVVGDWYPTIDHITPLCNGGSHSWSNVKLAHKRCNEVKGTKEKL